LTKFRGGTKFYILYVEPNNTINTDVIAFEDEGQLDNINAIINKQKYLMDLYNKFDNICRGLPNVKEMNDKFLKLYKEPTFSKKILRQRQENTNLFNWLPKTQ